jgi:hypothetical protein
MNYSIARMKSTKSRTKFSKNNTNHHLQKPNRTSLISTTIFAGLVSGGNALISTILALSDG